MLERFKKLGRSGEQLGDRGIYDLDTEGIGDDAQFVPLTDEELELLDPEYALEYAANVFRTLPDFIQKPQGSEPTTFDLMRVSNVALDRYSEVYRILTAKGLHISVLHDQVWE